MNMSLTTGGKEKITTAEAYALAKELGKHISQDAITQAAYAGRIEGAEKMWDNPKAPWVFSREAFLYWLDNRRSRGRPKKEEG